jgi:hypothetical protein
MRFSPFLLFFAGAALVNASPVLEKKAAGVLENRNIDVTNKDCDVITPKVFIISMV